jgi:hypothetical protein
MSEREWKRLDGVGRVEQGLLSNAEGRRCWRSRRGRCGGCGRE